MATRDERVVCIAPGRSQAAPEIRLNSGLRRFLATPNPGAD